MGITQSKVRLNTKITNVDLVAIQHDGVTAVAEGTPIKRGAGGVMAVPTGTNTSTEIVYINFVDTSRSDATGIMRNAFRPELPTFDTGGGGLAGILGQNTPVGLPASCWAGGALPSVNEGVFVDDSTGLFTSEAITTDKLYYGIVEYIEDNVAYFLFSSRPAPAKLA